MSQSLSNTSINLSYLIKQAIKSGYQVEKLSHDFDKDLYLIKHNKTKQQMFIVYSNLYQDQSLTAHKIAKHKYMTYLAFNNLVKMPKTYLFKTVEQVLLIWQKQFNEQAVVMKAEDLGLGVDIFVNLNSKSQIKEKAKHLIKNYPQKSHLIQEMIIGTDVRIQAVGGQLFAACIRKPAHVVGDGVHTIQQLIDHKNVNKIKIYPKNAIKIDQETKQLLTKQQLNLDSIPKKKQEIKLKKAANIGLGGDPIDVTDQLDFTYRKFVKQVSHMLQAKTFALDLMVEGKVKSMTNAYLLEINIPCMWAHHHFAEGQKRNVALAILDAYFNAENFNPGNEKYLI